MRKRQAVPGASQVRAPVDRGFTAGIWSASQTSAAQLD
jgi:hypothetical protein